MFTQAQLTEYLREVRQRGSLQHELYTVQQSMVLETSMGRMTKERTLALNQIFKVLLAEKARQEAVQNVRQDNGSASQDSSSRPADNTPGRVRIGDILKNQIA